MADWEDAPVAETQDRPAWESAPPVEEPAVQPSQVEPSQSRESTRPTISLPNLTDILFGGGGQYVRNAQEEVGAFVKSVPQMVEQLPGMAYQGLKFATGGPQEKAQVAEEALGQAIPQGRQISTDVQSPLGSRENIRGLLNLGMFAVPPIGGLTELLHPFLRGAAEAAPITESVVAAEKPPVQEIPTAREAVPEALQPKATTEAEIAAANRELAPVSEPPSAIAEPFPSISRNAEDQRRIEQQAKPPSVREAISLDELRLMRERNDLQLQNDIAKRATGATHPAVDERIGQIETQLNDIANRELQQQGGANVIQEPSTGEILQRQPEETGGARGQRERVEPGVQGEETPSARQGTEAQPAPQEVVPAVPTDGTPSAEPPTEKPPVQDAPPSGISTERLQNIYGKDAVIINQGKGAQEWQRIGQADKRDPYAVMSNAQKNEIATPADAALFRAEHQRLLNAARDTYGTPRYNELAQNALDFANATKKVVHGPAAELMHGLQEVDKPRYDSPADFDQIIRERMNRESTPEQKATFEKVADEVRNGNGEVAKSAEDAQSRLKTYKAKDVISFDEAVDHVRNQIAELTKDCV